MAFQLSPGVQVTEKDLTSVVPAVGTSIGGTAGEFVWGPINEVVTISSENELVTRFGKPAATGTSHRSWFAAASFLAYTSTLKVVRAANLETALNAGSTAGVLIANADDYINNHADGSGSNGMWAARYAGALGNSLKVSIADSSDFTGAALTGTITSTLNSTTVTGSTTAFDTELLVGSFLQDSTGADIGIVASIASATSLTLASNAAIAVTAGAAKKGWVYKQLFDYAPSTTTYASAVSATADELHVIVVDEDGLFTGAAGTVLEKFAGVSKASDAKDSVGRTNYYKNVINDRSKYVYWTGHPAAVSNNWGSVASGVTFTTDHTLAESVTSLSGGVNGKPTDGNLQSAFILFANDELVDVNLIFAGDASATVGKYVIDNVAEVRKDCMVFVSPAEASVVDKVGTEAANIVAEVASYTRSSYAVFDSGYKYMYDRYSDRYVWVPCNGDVAGVCAGTDAVADPWFSPAGYNRGAIKNAVKLSYSPSKSDRDTLYKAGVNPIVGFPGSGIVLFGDKTLLEKPSAFDRINVRRLFIVLEKAIATSAKFQLFEFNDAFTRAQFKNLVEPFLRDVQGRRGIYDFRVVCDETNNDSQVVDSNQFVADIFIQPAKSINFIQLNFIATRTGIAFEEVGA
jgi:phage tail sheath protein FI